MKPDKSFSVDFDYTLSENITLRLTANVQLHHSEPHYVLTDLHLKKNMSGTPLMSGMRIMAIQEKDGISWVHTDSLKETILSVALGKAIEAAGYVEVAFTRK